MVVHTVLPDALTAAVAAVLEPAGIAHVAHAGADPLRGAEAASRDADAIALIGPYRSRDVAHAVEATRDAGLPLLAPVATWVGVTRDDEPGCDDPADHRGTVLRMLARDMVVAQRLAADLRARGERGLVVAGEHEYGVQIDSQLRMAGLPRTDDPSQAAVVVLAGLPDGAEIARAAALAPLPVVAFDGAQGTDLGRGRNIRMALPFAPVDGTAHRALFEGVEHARRAAELVAGAIAGGARDRTALLADLRRRGPFDEHGDPVDPPVWLWRADDAWALAPERPL